MAMKGVADQEVHAGTLEPKPSASSYQPPVSLELPVEVSVDVTVQLRLVADDGYAEPDDAWLGPTQRRRESRRFWITAVAIRLLALVMYYVQVHLRPARPQEPA
jgi:hypothetical protein